MVWVGPYDRLQALLMGIWERNRVATEMGVVRSVVSMGNDVTAGLCGKDGFFIGRVSVADASLSLSLSLVEPAPKR